MKIVAALLAALVAVATVECHNLPDFGEGPLHDDIQYFMDMIPMDEAIITVLKYAAVDAEFQEALLYLQSDEFKVLTQNVQAIPEYLNFLNYLDNNGVRIFELVNMLNELLGLEPLVPGATAQVDSDTTDGLAGLFNELKSLISYDDFIHGYVYKMKTSPAFVDFVEELMSPNFQQLVNTLYKDEHFLHMRNELVKREVNVRLIEDVMFVVLRISFPTQEPTTYEDKKSQLSKDLEEFAKLAATQEVIEILLEYTTYDEEVQKGLEYMFDPEFHQMVRDVEALQEYQNLVIYLNKAGLEIYEAIQAFHEYVGMEDYVPPVPSALVGKYVSIAYKKPTGGFKGMVEAIKAALPTKELEALYEEKMRTSTAFREFIEVLHSDEFQKIIDSFYTHEIFLEMRKVALEAGLDLEALAELLRSMLGLNFPKP